MLIQPEPAIHTRTWMVSMTSPTRTVTRESSPAFAGRAVPAYVALVTAVAFLGLGISSTASANAASPATDNRVLSAPDSVRTPKQPATPQPEAVPPASFHGAMQERGTATNGPTPAVPAQFQEEWLLPLGGGLAALAALSVMLVLRSRDDPDSSD